MSYVHLSVENVDQKRSAKGEIPIKGCMAVDFFVYTPNKDIIMQKYLCDCEERSCLNFFSWVKNISNSSNHCLQR